MKLTASNCLRALAVALALGLLGPQAEAQTWRPAFDEPETFDLHPDGKRLFISNEEDAMATAIDIDTGEDCDGTNLNNNDCTTVPGNRTWRLCLLRKIKMLHDFI